jgi:hypothetical protein
MNKVYFPQTHVLAVFLAQSGKTKSCETESSGETNEALCRPTSVDSAATTFVPKAIKLAEA